MKKKQLKIKLMLFVALAVILGSLSGVYIGFCRGKGFNTVKVDIPTTTEEAVTEEPATEATEAEKPQTEPETEAQSETTEATTAAPTVDWAKYVPAEQLAGENWALTLINKKYMLDKQYTPETATLVDGSPVTADVRVAEAFKKMYNSAKESNVILTPFGGYCTYNRQKTNFDSKVQAFTLQGMSPQEAQEAAMKRIEPAGASESCAGLSVDILSASSGFANTPEYKWLLENAHQFGFILRYPQDKADKTGIIFQPWHWRFVGVDAATEMKNSNLCLEEYLKAE